MESFGLEWEVREIIQPGMPEMRYKRFDYSVFQGYTVMPAIVKMPKIHQQELCF